MGARGSNSPASIAERAAELAERAEVYAEGIAGELDVDEVSTADMQTITHAIARAFALGYAAALDDQRPVRPLGGAGERTRGEERRRRARRS